MVTMISIAVSCAILGILFVIWDSWNDIKFVNDVKNNPYHRAHRDNHRQEPAQWIPVAIDEYGIIDMRPKKGIDIRV